MKGRITSDLPVRTDYTWAGTGETSGKCFPRPGAEGQPLQRFNTYCGNFIAAKNRCPFVGFFT